MRLASSNSIKEEWERTRKLWEKCNSSKDLITAKKMKYFDETSIETEASTRSLQPQPDIFTNFCISLSEYNSIQLSKINISNISP